MVTISFSPEAINRISENVLRGINVETGKFDLLNRGNILDASLDDFFYMCRRGYYQKDGEAAIQSFTSMCEKFTGRPCTQVTVREMLALSRSKFCFPGTKTPKKSLMYIEKCLEHFGLPLIGEG